MVMVAPSRVRLRVNSPIQFIPESLRCKNVIVGRGANACRVVMPQASGLGYAKFGIKLLLSSSNVELQPCHKPKCYSLKGMPISHLSAASSPHLSGDQGSLHHKVPQLPQKNRPTKSPLAFRDDSYDVKRHSTVTNKPEWWWRTLACTPYLMALQMSNTAYYLLPLLEHLDVDNLVFYVPGSVQRLPWWFPMLYLNIAYFGVVRNKEWPHFFRFHVMLGMLLETALEIVWHSSNFLPLIHYNGPYAMPYWAAVGFVFIAVLLACIRSCLLGAYAKIPFISDSALIHTFFNMGRFYRPF